MACAQICSHCIHTRADMKAYIHVKCMHPWSAAHLQTLFNVQDYTQTQRECTYSKHSMNTYSACVYVCVYKYYLLDLLFSLLSSCLRSPLYWLHYSLRMKLSHLTFPWTTSQGSSPCLWLFWSELNLQEQSHKHKSSRQITWQLHGLCMYMFVRCKTITQNNSWRFMKQVTWLLQPASVKRQHSVLW